MPTSEIGDPSLTKIPNFTTWNLKAVNKESPELRWVESPLSTGTFQENFGAGANRNRTKRMRLQMLLF